MVAAFEPPLDVCVVGYGPTGVTLANLLGLLNLSVVAVDRQTAPYELPRAVHFDSEVMRVFQTIGLAEAILPTTHVSPGMLFVDGGKQLLIDWSRPMEVGSDGWHTSYRFHQPELERILREGAERYPSVATRLGFDYLGARQHADFVEVQLRDTSSGAIETVNCRYLVGADGARSKVREDCIGTDWNDLLFDQNWLVVDVMLKRPMPELGDHSIQYCEPERPATYVRGTGNRRRWEIALLPSEDPDESVRPDRIWARLERWVTPDDAELERAATYQFRSVINRRWRDRRIFIAGDAAHLTPPFLGQGLCAGIRDVANLAWKLAAALKDDTDQRLLDSYADERIPHVTEYIAEAVRLGEVINTCALKSVVGGVPTPSGSIRIQSIMPRLGEGLTAGWSGPAGRKAPQFTLRSGERSDDVIGYRHGLLARAGLPVASGRDLRVLSDVSFRPWLDDLGALAVLVRPDRYVLGAARTPEELNALLASVQSSTIESK